MDLPEAGSLSWNDGLSSSSDSLLQDTCLTAERIQGICIRQRAFADVIVDGLVQLQERSRSSDSVSPASTDDFASLTPPTLNEGPHALTQ